MLVVLVVLILRGVAGVAGGDTVVLVVLLLRLLMKAFSQFKTKRGQKKMSTRTCFYFYSIIPYMSIILVRIFNFLLL